jgi:hypothetical protein
MARSAKTRGQTRRVCSLSPSIIRLFSVGVVNSSSGPSTSIFLQIQVSEEHALDPTSSTSGWWNRAMKDRVKNCGSQTFATSQSLFRRGLGPYPCSGAQALSSSILRSGS